MYDVVLYFSLDWIIGLQGFGFFLGFDLKVGIKCGNYNKGRIGKKCFYWVGMWDLKWEQWDKGI